jgi:hypothetical protein
LEGFLDVLGGGGFDTLVDGERLPQAHLGLAGVIVVQVAVADSFQRAGFFQGHAEVSGHGQSLGVLLAGVASGRGPQREFAEAVECLGLAEPRAEVTE